MAAVDETTRPRGAPAQRPPAQVPGNLWTEIAAAELGGLAPTLRVSVVVGGEDPEGLLPLTLASLAAQGYPAELTEVLVERDAGTAPDTGGEAPAVRTIDSLDEAEGEVVLLVEVGSIAERNLVEAHARWHHAVCDAVSVGVERGVDAGGVGTEEVADAAVSGRLAEALASRRRESRAEGAVEDYLERTRQLTAPDPDSFWVAATGTVAVGRELLADAGDASGLDDPPLARLDLAWRLATAGAVIVPERDAVTYAHYDRAPAAPRREESEDREPSDPRAADVIPSPGYRATGSGRRRRRPALRVQIPVDDEPAAGVLDTLDGLLRGRFSDLEAVLLVPSAHPDRGALELACEGDPRVSVAAPSEGPNRSDARALVSVPPGVVAGADALADLYELFVAEGVGAVHVSVSGRLGRLGRRGGRPGRLSRRTTLEARATGPLARASRVAAHRGGEPDAVLAELFGERAVAGAELGVRRRGAPGSADADEAPPAGELAHERAEHLRNRARAATNQARADRRAQLVTRERMRATHERLRADRLAARLAKISPRAWARWRSRQAAVRARAVPQHFSAAAGMPRRAALKARQVAAGAAAKRRD